EGLRQLVSPLPRLRNFYGMKMRNEVMKMNGDIDDTGMDMVVLKMDMNAVMYSEISAAEVHHEHGATSSDGNTLQTDHEHHHDHNAAHHQEQKNAHHYAQEHTSDHNHVNHKQHNGRELSSQKMVTLNYAMLKSPHKTTLPSDAPVKELRFELTGNMNRYVWS